MKRQNRLYQLLCVFSLVAIGALAWAGTAQAATETWVGGTATWNTAGNWSGTNLPPISNDSLIFGAAGAGGLLLNDDLTSGAFNIAGITYNAGAGAFVIGDGTATPNVGNTFALTGNVTNNSTSLQTINNPFSMTATRTFTTTAGGGDITLGGTITGAGSGITKNGLGTLTISSVACTGAITVSAGKLAIGAAASSLSGGLTLGSTSYGGTFVYDNAGAAGAKAMTLASLTASGQNQDDNVVQVTRSAAQDVFLTFTTQNSGTNEDGATINFVVNGSGAINGTNAKIVLSDQTAYRITKPNAAYFNGSDFAVYDAGPDGLYTTPADGFVRGISYGVDTNSRTSATGATFATNAVTGTGTTYNQEVTGDITAQTTVTLGASTSGQTNGTLKIVGASNITMASGATLTIDNANDTGTKGILKTGGGTSVISGGTVLQNQKNGMIRVDGPTDVLNIASTFSLGGSSRFMKSGAGTLILSGSVGTAFNGYTIWLNGGVMEFGGSTAVTATDTVRIADGALFRYNDSSTGSTWSGAISGAGGVTVSAGKLTVSGGNSFTGQMTVDGGTMAIPTINNVNASGPLGQNALPVILGKAGGVTGTLEYTGGSAGSNKAFTLASGGTGGFQVDAASTNLTLSGAISGDGGLAKTGDGRLTLTGANPYTGATTVSAGNLTVSGAGTLAATTALAVSGGAQFTYLPTVAATTLSLGTGATLNLASGSGIAETFGSTIAVAGAATTTGTVNLTPSGAFISDTEYTLLTAASGLNGASYNVLNQTSYTYSLAIAADSVKITPTDATPLTSAYWLGGLSGSTGVWAASNGATASNWTTDGAGAATPLVPGSGANVFFSDASATAGNQINMTLGADMAINSLTVNGTAGSPNNTNPVSLLNTGGYTLTIGGASGITVNADSGTVTLNANIALGNAQTWTTNSANPLAVSGNISGTAALTKAGTGALTLSGANTFTGQLTVEQGILNVATINNASADGPLGNNASSVILGKSDGSTGTLQYTGAAVTSNKKFSMATGGKGAFQVDTAATVLTLSGVIDGSGGLVKSGAGALAIGNSNTYTGKTVISGGTLRVGGSDTTTVGSAAPFGAYPASFQADNITINDGGTLYATAAITVAQPNRGITLGAGTANVIMQGGQNEYFNSVISGDGNLSITATGNSSRAWFRRPMTYGGTTTLLGVNSGTMGFGDAANIANDGSLVNSPSLSLSCTAVWQNIGNTTYAGVISGSGSNNQVQYNGAGNNAAVALGDGFTASLTTATRGTLTLTGANTYTVGTVINSGGITLAGNGTLGNVANTLWIGYGILDLGGKNIQQGQVRGLDGTIRNGTLTSTGGFFLEGTGANGGFTVSANLAGNVALTKSNAGTATLSGINTYTGNTIVNAGTLNLADNAGLKFVIGATGVNNWITGTSGGTVSLAGDFTFDLSGAGTALTDQWTIVNNATLAATYTSTFTVAGFTDNGDNTWSKAIPSSSNAWKFSESTGILSVGSSMTPGDANLDGVVDAADYITLKRNFGTTGAWAQGNFSDTYGTTGPVDYADLQILMKNMGNGGSHAPATTPEPATIGLLAFGALAVIRRRRRS